MKNKILFLSLLILSHTALGAIQEGVYDCDNERYLSVGYDKNLRNYIVMFSHHHDYSSSYKMIPFITNIKGNEVVGDFALQNGNLHIGKIALSKWQANDPLSNIIKFSFEENINAVITSSYNNPINPQALVTCGYSRTLNEFVY